jgi:hypothetical protein
MERSAARNEDFNISTARSTSVLELAGIIWRKMRGEDTPLRVAHDPAFEHDVARRLPSVEKAARMLDVHCATSGGHARRGDPLGRRRRAEPHDLAGAPPGFLN